MVQYSLLCSVEYICCVKFVHCIFFVFMFCHASLYWCWDNKLVWFDLTDILSRKAVRPKTTMILSHLMSTASIKNYEQWLLVNRPLTTSSEDPTALAVGAGGRFLRFFFFLTRLSFLFSFSLWAPNRLKHCFKGPLHPKQHPLIQKGQCYMGK